MILSFDVGGTFIKWGLVKDFQIIEKGKVPTPMDSFEVFLETIKPIVSKYEPEALAFSLPGTMNPEKTQIFIGGAIRYNDFRFFPKEVSEYFGVPVTMENDANAAALAEIELGHLKNSTNGLVIVVGTGLGGVYVHNGEIIRGSHGYGGEISFLTSKNLYENAFMTSIVGEQLGMRPFIAHCKEVLKIDDLTGESFMSLVDDGNKEAASLLEEYMKIFAHLIYTLQIVYDPDTIVIGGGVSSNITYMNYLKKHVSEVLGFIPLQVPFASIEACTYYNDSNIMGAVVSYYRQRKG